jgi:hypothetical protein
MKRRRRSLSSKSIALTAVLVSVLLCALGAGSASAASRGFKLTNASDHELKLVAVQRIVRSECSGCIPLPFAMEFEGRPKDGSTLKSGATHDWELKYGFGISQGPYYAAELIYDIAGGKVGTEPVVVFKIYTYAYSNESTCQLHGADEEFVAGFECKAEGLKLTFRNAGKAKGTAADLRPQTVAEFHRLPRAERRAFALEFMTTEPVDPCTKGKTPLDAEAAEDALGRVVEQVRPGLTESEGRPIPGDAPVGLGIRAALEKNAC